MIGQEKLRKRIQTNIGTGLQRFNIITGPQGSGKKTIANYIGKQLQATIVTTELRINDIREVINTAYKQRHPTVYIIPDADRMNLSAKNALLKITEEPPAQAYFIMTLEDISNTLPTLKSRGNILEMDIYKPQEIIDYWKLKGYEESEGYQEIIKGICTVPGDCDILQQFNILEFNRYINTVLDNVGVVNGANAFKIGNKLELKKDSGGYDLGLFLRGVMAESVERCKETEDSRYRETIRVTSKYLQELNINGINKSMVFDMWILEMRGVWVERGN